jgi:transcriptional regulator with PAS, ATPase and Fis domain
MSNDLQDIAASGNARLALGACVAVHTASPDDDPVAPRGGPASEPGRPGSAYDLRAAVLGETPAIREIRALLPTLGRSDVPVLLMGETGTGKGLLARAIHGAWPAGPFVTIDCPTLPASLGESELFGYARGAFTGAVTPKRGLLELADGGTAFFDEIGELPLELQSKLLRVLEEKEFRPVGSTSFRAIHFRIIAATGRDLAEQVEQGCFRRDLYYRINALTIRIPPLRERAPDIPLLVEHFLADAGQQCEIPSDTWATLQAHPWPGNVRELRNWIQFISTTRCYAPHQGSVLGCPLSLSLQAPLAQPTARTETLGPTTASSRLNCPGLLTLAELEQRAVVEALSCTQGHCRQAARLLGIGRTTLYRKLRKYRLSDSPVLSPRWRRDGVHS